MSARFAAGAFAAMLVMNGQSVRAQEATAPYFIVPNAASRIAGLSDSVRRLLQREGDWLVWLDSTRGGVSRLLLRARNDVTRPAATAREAANEFVTRYRTSIWGLAPSLGQLELFNEGAEPSRNLHHFKFVQRHSGYRVRYGQLIIHAARVRGGYAVQGANGFLFPDIEVAAPTLSFEQARDAAVLGGNGIPQASVDSSLAVIADGDRYRLAYSIPISYRSRVSFRLVDATTGLVFGHLAAADRASPVVPAETKALRTTNVPMAAPVRQSRLVGFTTGRGDDWSGIEREFKVYDVGSGVFQLRDDGHNPGASEIRIRDASGYGYGPCGGYPYATETSTTWMDPEEVSAVHAVGVAVAFLKTSFGRNGWYNTNSAVDACVHGASPDSNAHANYFRNNPSLAFSGEAILEDPMQASQTVVTHEYLHGLTHWEIDFPNDDSLPMNIVPQVALNEGLSDYFGARSDNNACIGYPVKPTCFRDLDVVPTCSAPSSPSTTPQRAIYAYCLSQRFSAALWAGSKFANGSYAGVLDQYVFSTVVYDLTSSSSPGDAAYDILTRAKGGTLFDGSTRLSSFLEDALYNSSLTQWPAARLEVDAPSSNPYEWTVTIDNLNNMDAAVVFEIGSSGHYPDGSVVYPDSEIDLGYRWFAAPGNSITFEESETNYHYCGDGHAHGFRLTITGAVGTIPYWTGADCAPSLRAAPTPSGTLPSRFAVRQAIQPRDGTSPNLFGSSPATLAGRIRMEGVTALDIDIPAGSVAAPVQITVYNPQGRVVRRFASEALGPGTQRIPWDRKDDAGREANPGVYVVVVQHGAQRLRTHFVIPARP